jgi:hypothetical protein
MKFHCGIRKSPSNNIATLSQSTPESAAAQQSSQYLSHMAQSPGTANEHDTVEQQHPMNVEEAIRYTHRVLYSIEYSEVGGMYSAPVA